MPARWLLKDSAVYKTKFCVRWVTMLTQIVSICVYRFARSRQTVTSKESFRDESQLSFRTRPILERQTKRKELNSRNRIHALHFDIFFFIIVVVRFKEQENSYQKSIFNVRTNLICTYSFLSRIYRYSLFFFFLINPPPKKKNLKYTQNFFHFVFHLPKT